MASIHETETTATTSESALPHERRTTVELARQELCTGYLIVVSGMATIVWVILLVLTPPGSFDYALSLQQRLAFFGGLSAVCWPLGHALAAALLHFARLRSPIALGVTAVVGGAYQAVHLCAVALAIEELFFALTPDEITTGAIYLLCAIIAISHFGLLYSVAWQRAKLKLSRARVPVPAAPRPAAADPGATGLAATGRGTTGPGTLYLDTSDALQPAQSWQAAKFLNRLPREAGRDLVCIKGRGHYLNVVTTSGSTMVLMRFADAILELGGIGLQVHRSHWVAQRHIDRIVRRNGHLRVLLSNGDEVPVSRTYQMAVRAVEASRTAANGDAKQLTG
jgi:hypothetical protein